MPTISFVQLIELLEAHVAMDGPLWKLTLAICWVAGALFAYIGFLQLTEVSNGQRHGYKAPIMSMIAAIMMISAPELIKSFLASTFGNEWGVSPLSYVRDPGGANKSYHAVLVMISFIGLVFFVRGVWIFKEAGDPQRYHGSTVGKSIVVMGAGMAAIYIDFTLKMLGNTFGFDLSAYLN